VLADEPELRGAMLGCQQSRASAIQQGCVDGAGAWSGHVQNILADKRTAEQVVLEDVSLPKRQCCFRSVWRGTPRHAHAWPCHSSRAVCRPY
jgi:hypothetical protein